MTILRPPASDKALPPVLAPNSGDTPEAPLPFSDEPAPVRPANPQIMLQVSRDGGATWSAAVMRPLGAIGHYRQRIRWHRQGSGRDLVLRFAVSDPVPLTVLDQQIR